MCENQLRISQGDDVPLGLAFQELDLTGSTVYLRVSYGAETYEVNVSSHTDAAAGETTILLPAATTEQMTVGRFYDVTIWVMSAGGMRETWCRKGDIKLEVR